MISADYLSRFSDVGTVMSHCRRCVWIEQALSDRVAVVAAVMTRVFVWLLLLCAASSFLFTPRSALRQQSCARGPRSITTRCYSGKKTEEEIRNSIKNYNEVSDVTNGVNGPSTMEEILQFDESIVTALKQKRSYLSIVVERVMQAVDDIQLANKIKEKEKLGLSTYNADDKSKMEKVVVLGTGWGAHAFLKTVDATKYDIKIVSPRNYFMFTPMLAASAVGTVEFRSICEPIRNVNPYADYLEASAISINSQQQVVNCRSLICEGSSCDVMDFELPYDHLLVAVGATSNTYGIKGVRENCIFLKQIEDAANLRKAVANCFERANIPGLSDSEIRAALAFVVVGAGPTGVEFTGELRDWIEVEGRKYYGRLLKYISITLVEAGGAVLAVFDEQLQKEAYKSLVSRDTKLIADGFIEREMTNVILKAGVKEVKDKMIDLSTGESIPYGFCVWAAGNGPLPFITDTIESIPAQKMLQPKARGRLVTDRWLRVLGCPGIYSIGDCSFIEDMSLPQTAQVASQQGSYLGRLFSKGFELNGKDYKVPPTRSLQDSSLSASEQIQLGQLGVSKIETLKKVSATGAVVEIKENNKTEYAKPFQFLNLGVLAYVGASQALAQISVDEQVILGSGPIGFLLWRGIYWSKQVSWRNRVLVGIDWIRTRLFGRDIGNI